MKKVLLTLILTIVFISIGFSQPPPPNPQPIPIDGGLLVLLLGGIFLGGREVYVHEKNKKK